MDENWQGLAGLDDGLRVRFPAPPEVLFCTLVLGSWLTAAERAAGLPTRPHRVQLWNWLHNNGFDGVDLGETWINPMSASDDELSQVGVEAANRGLTIRAVTMLRRIVGPPATEDGYRENIRRLERAVDIAPLVEATIVNISISPQPWLVGVEEKDLRGQAHPVASGTGATDSDYERQADVLRSLADRAAALGVELSIELHQNSLADTAEGCLKLLKLIDRPNVGINPDIENLHTAFATAPESWEAALPKLAPVSNFWHVKSHHRIYLPGDDRAQFVGASIDQGAINYRLAMSIMAAAGYRGAISFEGGPGDSIAAIRRGRRYLMDILAP